MKRVCVFCRQEFDGRKKGAVQVGKDWFCSELCSKEKELWDELADLQSLVRDKQKLVTFWYKAFRSLAMYIDKFLPELSGRDDEGDEV